MRLSNFDTVPSETHDDVLDGSSSRMRLSNFDTVPSETHDDVLEAAAG